MTAVTSPLQLAGYQLRSVERPGLLLVLLVVLVPWYALVAVANGDFLKLGSFFFLHLLVMSVTVRDRRIYRSLGLTRAGAIRQELVLSVPALLLAGLVTLPNLSATGWIWVLPMGIVALAVDLAITLRMMNLERRGSIFGAEATTWAGPARNGSMSRRLLVVPMLRWSLPGGLLLGLVLGFGDPHQGTLLWSLLMAFGLLGLFVAPALEVQAGSAALATWQSLGLPRRAWARVVTPMSLLAPILGLAVAWLTLVVLGLWGVGDGDIVQRFTAAAPGFAVLLAGISLLVVSVGATGSALGAGFIGGSGPLIMIPSMNLLEDPAPTPVIVAAVAGGIFLLIGLYVQRRLVNAVSGARITPPARHTADS